MAPTDNSRDMLPTAVQMLWTVNFSFHHFDKLLVILVVLNNIIKTQDKFKRF